MPALTGSGVLVTRPIEQSHALCALLEQHGARTWRLPVLQIRGLDAPPPPAGRFDLLVFTSANAVRYGIAMRAVRAGALLAAIGPATARALNQAGHPVDVQPAGGFDSESLLADPQLAAMGGRAVLLVKGRGGRTLLEDELRRRGARVHAAEVYERTPLQPDAATLNALEAHAAAGELQYVIVTSAEIGARLLEVLTPALRHTLGAALWVLPSRRVATVLQAQGLRAPVHVARSADDQDMLAALLEVRGPSLA